MTRLAVAALILALALPAALAQTVTPVATTQAALERGRALTAQFYAVNLDPIWATFAPDLREALGGLAAFTAYRRQGLEDYGAEARVLDEEVARVEGALVYARTATFVKQPTLAWRVIWAFDPRGAVVYFNIEFAGPAPAPTPRA